MLGRAVAEVSQDHAAQAILAFAVVAHRVQPFQRGLAHLVLAFGVGHGAAGVLADPVAP